MRLTILFILFLLFYPIQGLIAQIDFQKIEYENLYSKLKSVNSDSLLLKHKKRKLKSLSEGDTLTAIEHIVDMSDIHATTGNYSQSYDGYWEALIYSNAISDSTHLDKVYRKLGMLYSIFRRSEKAEKYFDLSLSISKNHPASSINRYTTLNDTYYLIASHNREQGNYGLSEKYLDSCRIMSSKFSKESKLPFLEAEQGYIYYHTGKLDDALDLLLPNENYFMSKKPNYLVIFYSFLGDTYFKKGDFTRSETYYLKSLEFSEKYKSHRNYIPNLYQKLGDLYIKMNKMNLAYKNLQISKDLTDELFGARSKNNSDILEIKDTYRLEREHQKKILEASKLNELEQRQKILFLRNMVLSISIASLIIISSVIVWYLYKRRKTENLLYTNKQKLSEEKNEEILNIKNKELTASALQLIQKDELILEIKDKATNLEDSDKKVINQILTKIKINKNQDWTEFNARFTSVNKLFYKTLSEKYPELTQRDHKLCALIKLNFTSKRISQLLGISMESVNTSRYRLRKKMYLKTTDNLSQVIARL
jgi:tetratricopeptide (TPR) repeat protein